VRLLDHPQATAELIALERRTHWGGKETIDHAPGAHDDAANAVAGAAACASLQKPALFVEASVLARSALIGRPGAPPLRRLDGGFGQRDAYAELRSLQQRALLHGR
jgi:hypothetical protein